MMKLKNKIKKKKVEREGGKLKVTVRRSFIVGERRERQKGQKGNVRKLGLIEI